MGWYLMLPPATGQGGIPHLMIDAPISRWTIAQSFDTSKACEKELDLRRTRFEKIYKKAHSGADPREDFWTGLYMAAADSAECVATDDPRLRDDTPQNAQSEARPVNKPAKNEDSPQL